MNRKALQKCVIPVQFSQTQLSYHLHNTHTHTHTPPALNKRLGKLRKSSREYVQNVGETFSISAIFQCSHVLISGYIWKKFKEWKVRTALPRLMINKGTPHTVPIKVQSLCHNSLFQSMAFFPPLQNTFHFRIFNSAERMFF